MSAWIIYDKNGLAKCEARKLTYSGEFLGACSVSVNITSPTPIGFSIGDWLEYRGERFELNYDPSVVKESSLGGYGEGFVYENVVFNSLSDELTRCDFLDVVPADNGMHYSSLPTFSFFAENISALVERIQANLDRVYKAEKAWTLRIHPEYSNDKNANISASNLTCWDALALVNSTFGANFTIKGRTITIGTSGIAVGNLFSYGKGNGLYSIERNAESNQKIVTRLRAYGSTRNMPTGYYRNIEGGNVPNNMAVAHLMLPSFPTSTLDPYIDSKNLAELGVREGTVFFDGSGDLEEIYPSMEGMTAEDLKSAGVDVDAEGFLDEVASAEQIEDDGIAPEEGEIQATFTITLKDIGFDINDYLSTSGNATISMKNGMCGGREFEIVECKKEESNYILTCNRVEDAGLGLYFPYNGYQIKGGDKFVLLNLEMPDVYIKAASQRLLSAATEYLAKNDYVRYSFTPRVDNIMLAKQHDEAVKYGLVSIHDTIKEGDFILFEDNDLGISGSITIDALSIKENAEESLIPEYEITLKEEKTVGTIEKIQNQISSILNGSAGTGGTGGGVTNEQVKSILEAIGGKMFLSKQKDDKTPHNFGVGKSLSVGESVKVGDFVEGTLGSGASTFMRDGSSYSEVDFLKVRKKATFTNITIQELKHVGGEIILSPAAMVVSKIEELEDGYKCYFDTADYDGRKVYSYFEVGDQARCQTFNLEQNQYYWRLVAEVNEEDGYIVLSKTDCDKGSGIPKEGDNISQLGNRNDSYRQAAIILSAYGSDAPSYKQYNGINSYSLEGKQVTKLSPYGNELTGIVNIESGSTGASNLEDFPDEVFKAVHIGAVNLLLNSGLTGDYKSEELNNGYSLNSESELYSKALKHWEGIAAVTDDSEAVSGRSVEIGSLSQSVTLIKGENYVISFKAKGSEIAVSCGDFSVTQSLSSDYQRYSYKFVSNGVGDILFSGTAKVCDIQLERGTIATDWNPSPYDNDKAFAEFQSIKYLRDAIVEGDTSIIGGLILSSIIKLGNFRDGKMQKVNAGVSGIYNDDDDVVFWGGGTFEQAISTIMKFKQNPNFIPTEKEWKELANFVVSHGGDLFMRGTVFADNGYFRGDLNQGNGATILNKDGSGNLSNGAISWNQHGVMYRKAYDVILWQKVKDYEHGGIIDLNQGTYLDLSGSFGMKNVLPNADFDNVPLFLTWKPIGSRRDDCITLEGNFLLRTLSDDEEIFIEATSVKLDAGNREYKLTYKTGLKAWVYEGIGGSVDENGLLTIGLVVSSETEIITEKVSSNEYFVGNNQGLTQIIPIYENGGRSYFTFTSGILTGYRYESNEE